MLWMNASRASIKEEHPDAKVTDIGRIAGAKWKEMDAEAKAPWDAKAKADKERYEAEMKAYKAKFDEAGVDLAEVCAIWRKGGKWALMEKFSAMGITITRQHPRPRYKLAIGFTQACSS